MTGISRRSLTRSVALLSAVVFSVSITSCSPPSTTPSAPQEGLQVVSLPATAYNSAIGYLPVAVADALGYFGEEGIDLQPIPVGGGGESVRAFVADRNAVLGSVGFLAALPAIEQGEGFRIFGQLSQQQDTWIAVAADGPMAAPHDLKGRKLGVTRPGSSLEAVAQNFLQAEGMASGDVELVYLGSVPDLIVALEEGVVDAIAGNGFMTVTQHVDVVKDWRRFGEVGEYSPGVDAVYVAKDDDERGAELIEAFERAHKKAATYIAENPQSDELLEIVRTWGGSTDSSLDTTYRQALTNLAARTDEYFADMSPNQESFARAAEEGVRNGALTSAPQDWNNYMWSTR
jgi:NitT/TauT family transport system substrate-binding protein